MLKNTIWLCIVLSAWHLTLTLAVPKWDKKLVEAEQVALDSSGFVVPPPALVQKIMRDLKVIRSQYHEVEDVVNRPKWVVGELFARKITDDQIMDVEMSTFGPLENVKKYNFGTVLVFNKAYHPEVLSVRLMEKFGIKSEPNTSVGDAGNGLVRYDQSKRIYTFEKGPQGYSYPGYRNRHMWKFTVADGVAKLRTSARPGPIRANESAE